MHTNGSEIRTWDDRPKPDDATFSKKGVALEVMIDLCNRQQADAWFCMPHLADDDYVRNFARTVKEQLDPSRKVYVEYSNEVWNSQFPQTRLQLGEGQATGARAAGTALGRRRDVLRPAVASRSSGSGKRSSAEPNGWCG